MEKIISFDELNLHEDIVKNLKKIGFNTPTEIQAQAIPKAMTGVDLLCSAQTGTGKTGAYGIPLANHLYKDSNSSALILLPTRELAQQVANALGDIITNLTPISLLIGGEDMKKQIHKLRNKPRVIVGTPGRINDHLKRGTLRISNVSFLVLDEVDRMLDMGFTEQLVKIVEMLNSKRQTMMFSATISENIKRISGKYLTDPIRIAIGPQHKPAANITQQDVKISQEKKLPFLIEELERRVGSVIIFVNMKRTADSLTRNIKELKHKAAAIHGDLKQHQRNRVIKGFRDEKCRILVATDVAARGLDIPHIKHVINYDISINPEDHIHRIGRTARAGNTGEALNLISPSDSSKWHAIQRLINPEDNHKKLSQGSRKTFSKPRKTLVKKRFYKAKPRG